jgi:phage tail sheath protein FI
MATVYNVPGVYIEEVPHLPPSIASVPTAVPAFIGYTEFAQNKVAKDLLNTPWPISSITQFELFFGTANPESGILVTIDSSQTPVDIEASVATPSHYMMYYNLQMYFANGGGDCYIVSVGDYSGGGVINLSDLVTGLNATARQDDVTILLFPDSINITNATDYYSLHEQALTQCENLNSRVTVMDVWPDPTVDPVKDWQQNITTLRNTLAGTPLQLKYGAVYYPQLFTNVNFAYNMPGDPTTDNDALVTVKGLGPNDGGLNGTLAALQSVNNQYYFGAKNAIDNNLEMLLPASAAVVGVYAMTDNTRGVWKAPANVNITNAVAPQVLINSDDQSGLNVDVVAGKSINAIRTFPGRGPAIIWGARTLTGNDNEWRYISVRRLCNMLEISTRNAVEQFVFEPNDENTWVRVKSMIENYLTEQWKAGALMGSTATEAFYVKIGLGQTMTELDIWEGRLIVLIGIAPVRPAEFIILRFEQKMLSES